MIDLILTLALLGTAYFAIYIAELKGYYQGRLDEFKGLPMPPVPWVFKTIKYFLKK